MSVVHSLRRHTGVVSTFDNDAGLGIVDVDGHGPVTLHCVSIADGSRSIAVGTRVRCRLGERFGSLEALEVEAIH